MHATDVRREAERMLARGTSAVAVSDRIFGERGLLRTLWKTDAQREALVASPLYRWRRDRMAELRTRDAATFEREMRAP